jgi:iron complex outermembrane receptor protein
LNRNIFAALVGVATVSITSPAVAREQIFAIAGSDLKTALDTFARQSGRSVIYQVDAVRGATSPGFTGKATDEAALGALLVGTGFRPHFDGTGSIAIVGRPTAALVDDSAEAENANDDIVVTGIRGSLSNALETKRKSDSIVDSISAEDVGRFPDTNIAESVQRITGVQINRTRGEGRTVNIRGLPANFTLATLNGRTLPNAFSLGSARSFDFAVLPPEFVRSLEVYKAPVADIDDGGLAGVVNIRTPRALDIGKRTFSASAQGQYESNSGKWAPRVSAFYADTFADGRIGVAIGASYTGRKAETHTVGTTYTTTTEGAGIVAGSGPLDLNGDGVIEPARRFRYPGTVNHVITTEDRDRYSLVGSLDFKASDTLTFRLDSFYSKIKSETISHQFLGFFTSATRGSAARTEVLDGIETATDFTVQDLDLRANGRFDDSQAYLWSTVLGGTYQSDDWTVAVEGSYGKSRQVSSGLNLANIANGAARVVSAPGDDLPDVYFLDGFEAGRDDPTRYRVASINGAFNRVSTDNLWDAKIDIKREFESSFITAIRAGAKYVDRRQYQDNSFLTVTSAGVSNLYGGLPAGPLRGSFTAAPFLKLVKAGSGTFLDSYKGDAVFPTQWLSADTKSFVEQFTDAQLLAAGTYTNDATGIINVAEKTLAFYGRADFETGRLTGNIGLRAVRTKQSTVGVSPDLNGITIDVEAGAVTRVPAAGNLKIDRSYWDFLPSLNLKFQATDTLLFRASASRTIARPNLMDISPTTSANGRAQTVTRNNPYLDPFRATNLDFTAEWYFAPNAVLGTSLFYKKLQSLIRRETVVQSFPVTNIYSSTGTRTVSNLDFTVSELVNGSGVSVKGAEFYYQQAFTGLPAPFDGLGTLLNYTYIDNSDPTQLTAASRHNLNATVYYEKGPVGVRLAYSWRDGFLSSVALAPAMSQANRAYGSLDGSISFTLNEHASFVIEAVNILDADEISDYTTGLPANYANSGRRISVGARVNF